MDAEQANPFEQVTSSYNAVRPGYPAEAIGAVLAVANGQTSLDGTNEFATPVGHEDYDIEDANEAQDLPPLVGDETQVSFQRQQRRSSVTADTVFDLNAASVLNTAFDLKTAFNLNTAFDLKTAFNLNTAFDLKTPAAPELSRAQQQLDIVDIGAGTGRLTAQFAAQAHRVVAVEPAEAMRIQFRQNLPEVPLQDGTATETGLPDSSADLVTYGQCWHWLEPEVAAQEAARILRPQGTVAILFNQLSVEEPWVKRLTRIMRSGDVHRPDRPPLLGQLFAQPHLYLNRWNQRLTPEEIQTLSTTRASYLRSNPAGKQHMQNNLRWYLYEHLGMKPGKPVILPYMTLTWTAKLLDKEVIS